MSQLNNNILLKYSNFEIASFFYRNSNLKNQISPIYFYNSFLKKKIVDEIIDRHIQFRDALLDPINPANIKIIEDHQKYFWNPNIVTNSQIRGPQTHLSQQMYRDFASAGNGIQNTKLTGKYFSSLVNTKNKFNVYYPIEVYTVSGDSFNHGLELNAAKTASSALDNNIYYTNDDKTNLPNGNIVYNNMPSTQRNGDFGVTYKSLIGVVSVTDAKFQSIDVAVSSRYCDQPRCVSVGTVDLADEKAKVMLLAQRAMIGILPITHVDPTQNNPLGINNILTKLKKDGLVEDARLLIGFPNILSNRHNE